MKRGGVWAKEVFVKTRPRRTARAVPQRKKPLILAGQRLLYLLVVMGGIEPHHLHVCQKPLTHEGLEPRRDLFYKLCHTFVTPCQESIRLSPFDLRKIFLDSLQGVGFFSKAYILTL